MNPTVRIAWLDYARLVCAAAVMVYHYAFFGPTHGIPADFGWLGEVARYGYMGVDFFFIVSGFVILYSAADRPPDAFAVSRAIRLYPAFLTCMTLTAIVLLASGLAVTPARYAANLTIVPAVFHQDAIDGVYWSLPFELAFYAAIFVVLAARLIGRIEGIVEGWILAQALLLPLPIHLPLLSGYYSLFAGGCVLSFIYRDGLTGRRALALAAAMLLSAVQAATRAVPGSPWITVPLTCAFFAVFLLMRRCPDLPGARTAGAITYPLYLLHAAIGYEAFRLFPNPWIWFAAMSILMPAAAWAVARFVEQQFRRTWRAVAERAVGRPIRRGLVLLYRLRARTGARFSG